MSLRIRLWLLFAPLILLLAATGAAFIYSLGTVGTRIDAILRENYRSVEAMTGINEAVERIDSSFQFALTGQRNARDQFDGSWAEYWKHLEVERNNITEPGEAELVARLNEATDQYRIHGERFFQAGRSPADRHEDYFGKDGIPGPLQRGFADVKMTAREIRELNQESMIRASRTAQETAVRMQFWTGLGVAVVIAIAGILVWRTIRTLLRPIEDLTHSARAVGDGRFDQVVTAETRDEIGALVVAFNRMTAQLRDLRQTHAARLLRAQQASQAAIDSFPDPVLVVDPSGRVEMANPAAGAILGVTSNEDRTSVWQPPESLRPALNAALTRQEPHRSESFERAVSYRVGAEERTFLPQVLPVRDAYGGTLGAAVVLNDVTRFRLLDEFKTDLVATASHEFKTPLAGLRLALHLLLEETVGPLNGKQSELLIDARDNTERLVRIVDHLLVLARLERGQERLTLRPTRAEDLLRAAAERVEPVTNSRQIAIDKQIDPDLPLVNVDADRLGQALDNLIVNAATYTEPGGRITLSAKARDEHFVELAVSDTGIGIPKEYVPHVFEKFFRIPEQSRGVGTGLGLAIVREVVLAHGGDITCESEPSQGTKFCIRLPVASRGPPA